MRKHKHNFTLWSSKLVVFLFDAAEQGPKPATDNFPVAGREPNWMLYIFNGAHFQQFHFLFGDFRI